MDSPSRPTDTQRWLRFKNVGTEAIAPFAVIGPQLDRDEAYDAIETNNTVDFALRLGRPSAAAQNQQDASLFYVNGSQEIRPKQLGRCTQTGMMQALIGYETDSPPAWGDGLSIDTSQTKTPFYLVPGGGGYKFIDFDGCPKTTFKDSGRTGYKFQVGWIVPASQSTVLDGAIIKDSSTLTTLESGDILAFNGRDNPELVTFGLSQSLPYSSDTDDLKTRGFHRINTTGSYLFNFTARIRSTDSDINASISGTLRLTCRTNRVGDTDELLTADQVEALADENNLDEESADLIFRKLRVSAEDQPADTNLVEGEVTEKHRHWQTVSGSTVLELTEGELLFVYNPTGYAIEVSSVSGTLVLLTGGGGGSGSSASSSSGGSSSGDSGGSGGDTSELDSRVTAVEADVATLESDLGTLETTVSSQGVTISSHTSSIATNASGISTNAGNISTNASGIADHETRIGDLETFETSAAASIAANASAISANSDDITTNAAAISANASDIDDLETFQTSATASIATNASDIDDLETFQTTTEAIFAGAIADGTYTLAGGDEVTTAGGVITDITAGPASMPGTPGLDRQFPRSNGDGTMTWSSAVHRYWSEVVGTGHLIPATTNTHDVGTTSKKVRSIYVGTNATIDGTLTVGGTNVMTAIGALETFQTTTEAIFTAAIADGTYTTAGGDEITVASGVVTGFTQGSGGADDYGSFVEGLLINSDTDTDHDLEIGTGRCASSDGAAIITCSTPVVIAIDDSGDRVDSSTLDTNTDYYALAGMDGSSFVAGFSKVDSLPSGWDSYRAIGKYTTNGSSNLREAQMLPDRSVVYAVPNRNVVSYTTSNAPTSATKMDLGVPGDSIVNFGLTLWSNSPGSYFVLDGHITTTPTDGKDFNHTGDSNYFTWQNYCGTDSQGRIWSWAFVSTVPEEAYYHAYGYKWVP